MNPPIINIRTQQSPIRLPCQEHNPRLWFSDQPSELNRAKDYCRRCPYRCHCLAGAVKRAEPHGVWGGEILPERLDHSREATTRSPPDPGSAPSSRLELGANGCPGRRPHPAVEQEAIKTLAAGGEPREPQPAP